MAPQNNSRSSLTGALQFGPGIQSDIEKADKDLGVLKDRIVTLKQGANLGKDLATQAGYNPNDRNRITALLRRGQELLKESTTLKQEIRIAKEAVEQHDRISLAGLNSNDDEEARNRVASRVVKLMAESPDKMKMLTSQLTPATSAAIQRVLAQGSRWSDDLAAVQRQLDTANGRITDLDREVSRAKQELRQAQDRHDESNQALSKDLADAKDKLQKEEDVAKTRIRQLELDVQAAKDDQKNQLDSFKAENVTLEKKAQDLELQLRNAQVELRNAEREHADESSVASDYRRALERTIQEQRQASVDQDQKIKELERALVNKDSTVTQRDRVIHTRDQEIQSLNERISKQQEALDEKYRKIEKLEKASKEKDNTIKKRDDDVHDRTRQIRLLNDTVTKHQSSLAEKDQKIQNLENLSDEKDNTIAQRNSIIKTQVKNAAKFFGTLSEVGSSSVLKRVAKEVLVDTTLAPLVPVPSQEKPWDIISASDETSLKIELYRRNPETIAIQILVALDDRLIEDVEFLSWLCGLQKALRNDSIVLSMIPMLLGAFTTADVHVMHRLVMCQITNLLAPTDESLHHFSEAMDNVDPLINGLVKALEAYTSGSLVFRDTITLSSLALVGLHRRSGGIIVVHLVEKQICWVGLDHITMSRKTLKLSGNRKSIDVPLESRETLEWATSHV